MNHSLGPPTPPALPSLRPPGTPGGRSAPEVTVVLADPDAEDLDLLLRGGYRIGPRYLTAAERRSVRDTGTLPDGSPWDLPLALGLPAGTATEGGQVLLLDREAVPMATLDVVELSPGPAGRELAAGPLRAGTPRSDTVFAPLRARAGGDLATGRDVLVVPTGSPLLAADLAAVRARTARRDVQVTVLALTGTGHAMPAAPLVRSLLALPGTPPVRTVALPRHPELEARRWRRLLVLVASAFGASEVLLPSDGRSEGIEAGTDLGPGLPIPVHVVPTDPGWPRLRRLLDSGAPVPATLAAPGVVEELRLAFPPLARRGLALFFTGLSGSGKSTLARAVTAALVERSPRSVTLLDGDEVRTVLSAGLTFSRRDREINVSRISFVAAEVAAHGGTAVCAPIAPYAAMRDDARRRVEGRHGEFVLVHVATPLAVCEARDRKGLYAKARAGLVQEFTGISDPYEEPTDADLVLDTTALGVEACVQRVLDLLRTRGLLAQ